MNFKDYLNENHQTDVIKAVVSTSDEKIVICGKQQFHVIASDYGAFGRIFGSDLKLTDGSELDIKFVDEVRSLNGKILYSKKPWWTD